MYLKQSDLFWDMDKDFVKEAMEMGEKINPSEGDILFREGDSADYFYVLIKGRVKLSIGEPGPVVYMARHAGEVVGWSSLNGRDSYSATAACVEPSNLIKFDSEKFSGLLEEKPEISSVFYKRLAQILGNRLLLIYPSVT